MIDQTAFVHDKAHVDDRLVVHIGARSKIWQFASIIRGAAIGSDCNVASCAIIDGAVIGSGTLIGHGAQIHPGVLIGSHCFIGPGVIFTNDAWPRADKIGFDPGMFQDGFFTTLVTDDSNIGAGAVILPGVTIRGKCMIAAGARVDRDVPSGMLFTADGEIRRIDGRTPIRTRIRAGHAA